MMKNPEKEGGKGILPLGCLPLFWGREGVTLLATAENKRITRNRISAELKTKKLFKEPVVRRFISDEDIVRVTLGHAGVGNPDEFCVGVHLRNGL